MTTGDLPRSVLDRRAIVYIRQSTLTQVKSNLESQRRQYALADLARDYGFVDVLVIDEDLGRSASGSVARPGFESLVAQLCQGVVGAVLCLEASRLARNGRDWHHLLDLCGLVGARVIDVDGQYDPSRPNDRLLLGMKGTMSAFELTLIRGRLVEGAAAKAARGELRISVPIGYVWDLNATAELDPDRRVQDAIRRLFRLFDRLGSARKVHRHLCENGILFPRPKDGKQLNAIRWALPAYRNVISVLHNPFYAGAYAYGKSEVRTTVVDGRIRKSYGHARPIDEWTVLLKDHHEGYTDWPTFERNQERLARNAYSKKAGGAKSGRGGRALLSGSMRCRRCGRMLTVAYAGRGPVGLVRYMCRNGGSHQKCISFGGTRPDQLIAQLLLDAVQPIAIEAAVVAHEQTLQMEEERRLAFELEVEEARFRVQRAQRQYETVDPDNRLVASELEARWNRALQHLGELESRRAQKSSQEPLLTTTSALTLLAEDLEGTWNDPRTVMHTKQRLLRTLIEELIVNVDDASREVIITVHWKGGEHSEHRVQKPRTGEHRKRAPEQAEVLVREMAGHWSDEHIAASLNRLGLKTGQNNSWSAQRVDSFRKKKGISAYGSPHRHGQSLTMRDAAAAAGVSSHVIRKLIRADILPARQIMKDAPWQIQAEDLARSEVKLALEAHRLRRNAPRRPRADNRTLKIPGT